MEDWVKIQSFDRLHQAELRKDILEKNDITAVIVNERDSLFLIGEIELYVKKEDEKKACALIDEFQGLTKVNSFILEKPVTLLKEILDKNEIYAIIKEKDDTRFMLENFELYVRNEDVAKTVPFLTGEKLIGWKKIVSCQKTRQTRFRVEILEENNIDSIVIKKRDSEYHKEEILIYVKNIDEEIALKLLSDLIGWIKIESFPKYQFAEIREDILGKHNIKALVVQDNQVFNLFVECNNEEKSIEIINQHTTWKLVKSFDDIILAEFAKEQLEENQIHAVLMDRTDSIFVLGDIDLYVDDYNVELALKVLNDIENIEKGY